MLTSTNIYTDRLIALLTEGFPLARTKEKEGSLNFDFYICKTFRCLAGWWTTTERAKVDRWYTNSSDIHWKDYKGLEATREYFGLDTDSNINIFGLAYNGTLDEREALVKKLIEAGCGSHSEWVKAVSELQE